jgi:hypothetical protein
MVASNDGGEPRDVDADCDLRFRLWIDPSESAHNLKFPKKGFGASLHL